MKTMKNESIEAPPIIRHTFTYDRSLKREKDPFDHLYRLTTDFRYYFCRLVWPASSGDVFKYSRSFDMLAETAIAFLNGELQRVVVCIPPRNAKSLVFSIGLPTYDWLTNPSRKFINVSHHADVLKIFSKNRQAVFAHSDYPLVSKCKIKTNSIEAAINNKSGHILCFDSVNIKTGLGADRIICDDPISAANSGRKRCDLVAEKYDDALLSRMNSKTESGILVVSQRINDFDMPSRLIPLGYDTVILPSIQPIKQIYIMPNSGIIWERAAGDVLNPDHEPLEVLNEIKKNRPKVFAAQYQQAPTVVSSGILRSMDFSLYDRPLTRYDFVVLSIDSASSNGLTACPWAIVALGVHWNTDGARAYDLLGLVNRRMNYVEGLTELRAMITAWQPDKIIIENKSTGAALIPVLTTEGFDVIPINPKGSKEQRTMEMAAVFNNGRFRVPNVATNIHTEVMVDRVSYEVDAFPEGRTDDILDALVQAFYYFETSAVLDLRAFFGVNR